ncbi:hypothetical protein [Candidatus Methylacidiphilum infernorum]|uniref:hypothetical protein n=1 Tax=Candidatus Methylacidiphilum infernorum TaxID=511746 RepID=UPI0011D10649|nr:hypothetical protein [Candidatus Methylacidiphilum infernorum]
MDTMIHPAFPFCYQKIVHWVALFLYPPDCLRNRLRQSRLSRLRPGILCRSAAATGLPRHG